MDTYEMKKVVERASSFHTAGWNLSGRGDQLTPFALAEAGFFCTGSDIVQCHACRGVLTKWARDDVPMTEHRKHFPACPFVKAWDKKVVLSHEGVKLAMGAGVSWDVVYSVTQKAPSLLKKSSYVLCEVCKQEAQVLAATNEAEHKRVQQEPKYVEEDWLALVKRYHKN